MSPGFGDTGYDTARTLTLFCHLIRINTANHDTRVTTPQPNFR